MYTRAATVYIHGGSKHNFGKKISVVCREIAFCPVRFTVARYCHLIVFLILIVQLYSVFYSFFGFCNFFIGFCRFLFLNLRLWLCNWLLCFFRFFGFCADFYFWICDFSYWFLQIFLRLLYWFLRTLLLNLQLFILIFADSLFLQLFLSVRGAQLPK